MIWIVELRGSRRLYNLMLLPRITESWQGSDLRVVDIMPHVIYTNALKRASKHTM